MSVIPLLSHHLKLLNAAYAVFGIEDDNGCAFDICKACHGRLTGITGGRSQNYNLVLYLIFLCCGRHEMRQNGKSHIFKCNGTSMIQFQVIRTGHFR